jgi:hypothetical protein
MTEHRQSDQTHRPPPHERRWDEVDWDTWTPESEFPPPPPPGSGPNLAPLFALIDVVRGMLPRELRAQFNSLVREVLLTLRSLIDWYLEKLGRETPSTQVEDIPID